jgi:hypothetical protein
MNRLSTLLRIGTLPVLFLLGTLSALAQHPRTVIIEEFTSSTCDPCVQATSVLNAIIAENPTRVATIRYHLNIPYPGDPFYAANAGENDKRKQQYDITGIPNAIVGGEYGVNPRNKSEVQARVNTLLGQTTSTRMTVTQILDDADPNKMNVTITITTGADALNGFRLRASAVESFIHMPSATSIPHSNGETEFYDVMRKVLTGEDGVALTQAANTTKTYSYSYIVAEGWEASRMYTVAFIQDAFDPFTVAQAGFSTRPVSRVVGLDALAGYALEDSRPNPVVDAAVIGYSLGAPESVTLTLYNLSGEAVARYDQGARAAGSHDARIDMATLPAGSYTLAIEAGKFRASTMLNVVR